jgi:hypothetical protein
MVIAELASGRMTARAKATARREERPDLETETDVILLALLRKGTK